MKTYRITFDRIGRNHNVAPMLAKVDDAAPAEQLAAYIHKHARPHLRSRDFDVFVELDKGTGFIACGMHTGGEFTIRLET